MSVLKRFFLFSVVALAAGFQMPARVSAQEAADAPSLELELNAMEPSDKGCRQTFVVTNRLGADLSKAAFEIALFNEAGAVDRLTVLDFKDLPKGKTKVTRFDLPRVECAHISRVLINQVTECKGEGVDPQACLKHLDVKSRTGTEFGL